MNNVEQKQLIVNIADKVFKIKIDVDEEKEFLETMKNVNQKIKEYKSNIPGLNIQEYLGMAIIWMAAEQNVQVKKTKQLIEDSLIEKINQWTKALSEN